MAKFGDADWARQLKNPIIPNDLRTRQDTSKEGTISYEQFTRMQRYNADQQQRGGHKLPSRQELVDSMVMQVNGYENSFEGWKQLMKDKREAEAMRQGGSGPIRPGEIRRGDERYMPY